MMPAPEPVGPESVGPGSVGVVVIGRNEGERLKRCLASIPREIPTVYVDSGSTDQSVAHAQSLGVHVIALDLSIPFTAARARNAGWRWLARSHPAASGADGLAFVQFVDGDCELEPGWLAEGVEALATQPGLAAVFGRLRERHPERSLYNRMCDEEWNVPVGLTNACGGIAMMRMAALQAVDGFSDDLVAGEEPDLCLRLRAAGWAIRRIPPPMAWHDANILFFRQWWLRTRRGGLAYAAHVLRHGPRADPQWRRQVRSIAVWGALWPLAMVAVALAAAATGSAVLPAAVLAALGLSYAIQILRVTLGRRRRGTPLGIAAQYGVLIVLGKFAEAAGMLTCWRNHLRRRPDGLIEYKHPS